MQPKNSTLVIFGNRLASLMREKEVTQMQMAKEFHVSQSAVSKWVKGTVPNGETLVRMAIFFGVTPETLVGLESFYEQGLSSSKGTTKGQGIDLRWDRKSTGDYAKDVETLIKELHTRIATSLRNLPPSEASNVIRVLQHLLGCDSPRGNKPLK